MKPTAWAHQPSQLSLCFPGWPSAPPRQVLSPQEQPAPAPSPAESLGALCKQISSPCPDPPSVLDEGCPAWGCSPTSSTLPAFTFLFSHQAGLGMKVSSSLAYLPSTSPCLTFVRVLCITWDDLVFLFIVGLPPTPVLFTVVFLELCLGHSRHSINIW